jgi:YbbR domain-containing protein
MEVMIDASATKRIPVQVDWSGKMPDGIRITDVKTIPETVMIKGRSKLVDAIQTVYTARIPVEGIKASGSTKIPLVLEPKSLSLAPSEPATIEVKYTVEKIHTDSEDTENGEDR